MDPQAPENGYKTVKMLPPVKFGTGPECPVPADLAAAFMLSVWQLDEGQTFRKHIAAAMGGKPVTKSGRGSGRGRALGSG